MCVGSIDQVKVSVANEQLFILKAKWVFVIVGAFAQMEEKEEGNDDHIGGSAKKWEV